MSRPWTLAALVLACSAAPSLADCRAFPFSQWQPVAERVVLRPRTLLTDFPDGGTRMAFRVTIIGASSRAGLGAVLKTALFASAEQRSAIADGLVAAARLCDPLHPDEARRIELAVSRSSDLKLREAFRTAFQSQLSREAQTRSQQLGESLQRRAEDSSDLGNTGLFNPRNTGPVAPIGAVNPVPLR